MSDIEDFARQNREEKYNAASPDGQALGDLIGMMTPAADRKMLDSISTLVDKFDEKTPSREYVNLEFRRLASKIVAGVQDKSAPDANDIAVVSELLTQNTWLEQLQTDENEAQDVINQIFGRATVSEQCDFLVNESNDESLTYVRDLLRDDENYVGYRRRTQMMLDKLLALSPDDFKAEVSREYDGINENHDANQSISARLCGAIAGLGPAGGMFAYQATQALVRINGLHELDLAPTRRNPIQPAAAKTAPHA